MHYLLFYELPDDYLERRVPLRPSHLSHAQAAVARGELLLGGALAEPPDLAILLFQGDSEEVAASFAITDPYVIEGMVVRWWVRQWTTVVGPLASVALPQTPPT